MTAGSRPTRSRAGWVTLLVSALVVGGLVAVALVEESQREQSDAGDIEVTFDKDRATQQGESYFVPYTIRNTGSDAISSAEIWFEVVAGDKLVETAEITVQFLPLRGYQNGIFVTAHDPASATLRVRLESVLLP